MKLHQGRLKLLLGSSSSPRGWSQTGTGSQGSDHGTKLLEIKKRLDDALRLRV